MTATLYDLILSVDSGIVRECFCTVRQESKSAVLLRYLLHLKEHGLSYDHGRAVCHVYGVKRDAGEYRKKYTAFMRMNERLRSRLEEFLAHHGRQSTSPALESAMTDAEKLYYRARALFNEGQFSRAASLLKEATRHAQAGECSELMAFQIAALHSRAVDKHSLFDELSEEHDIPRLLARALCNLFWQYQYYGAHLLRKEKSEHRLLQLEAEYSAMAGHPLVQPYAAIFEMLSVELRELYAFATGNTALDDDTQRRLQQSKAACREANFSFLRPYGVVRGDVDVTEYYKRGLTALSGDDLEEARRCFAAIAEYFEAGKGTFEHIQAMHISILFALGHLASVPHEVGRLRAYAAQREDEFYTALSDYYSARHALYRPDLPEPGKTIAAILRLEHLCDNHPLGQVNVLRTKAKFYYRTGDAEALDAVAAQLRSRRYTALNIRYIRQFVAFLSGVLDYRTTASPELEARLDRRKRELLTLKPGERYAKGFLAGWIERFCSTAGPRNVSPDGKSRSNVPALSCMAE